MCGSPEQDQPSFLAGSGLQEGFLVVAYDLTFDGTKVCVGVLRLLWQKLVDSLLEFIFLGLDSGCLLR